MINDNTILSSFDDRPTLLEWLKKVEDALKTDTATAVSVDNPSANTYVFKITFADGETLSSGNVVFPDSVKDVSIKNGHIIVTQISGTQTDLGAINPYADTIVLNAVTNDVEINGETKINAGLEVLNELNCDNIVAKGAIQTDRDLVVTGNEQVGGRLQVNSSIISNGEIRGGNISGTKFLLGTEEMPLVKANPMGEATATLEKVKIGDVAYNVGGGIGKRTLTIPSSELTISPDDNKKAFFPSSRNALIDSLFEVNGYQSLRLIYPQNGGFMNVPLEMSTIAVGVFKLLVYEAPSQALVLKIGKNEGDASYFFSCGDPMANFLPTVESFEFIEIN